jgi:hypothetical protein
MDRHEQELQTRGHRDAWRTERRGLDIADALDFPNSQSQTDFERLGDNQGSDYNPQL